MNKLVLKYSAGLILLYGIYYNVDIKTIIVYIFREKIKAEKEKLLRQFRIKNKGFVKDNKLQAFKEIPSTPKNKIDIIKDVMCFSGLSKCNKNKISGCIYTRNEQLDICLKECFEYFHR